MFKIVPQGIKKALSSIQLRTPNKGKDEHAVGLIRYSVTRQSTHNRSSADADNTKLPVSYRRPNRLWIALRTIGLHVFSNLNRRPEVIKPAVYRSRTIAALRCMVHVIPFTGALFLLYLNFSNYYIGNFNPNSVAGLQFAAKLLEMSMIASLTTVFLSYIRRELLSEEGLPFGAAFAGLQVNQLTYLWSPDFWGAVSSRNFSWPYKIRIFCLIVGASVLMATVGPASAACMIPRAAEWPAYPAIAGFNVSSSQLFPVKLTTELYNTSSSCQTRWVESSSPIIGPCSWSNSSENIVSLAAASGQFYTLPDEKFEQHSPWLALAPSYGYGVMEYIPSALTLYDAISGDYPNSVATSTQPLGIAQLLLSWLDDMDVKSGLDAYSWVQMTADAVLWQDLSATAPSLQFSAQDNVTIPWLTASDHTRIFAGLEQLVNGTTSYYNDFFLIDLPNSSDTAGVVMATAEPTNDNEGSNSYNITQGVWLAPFVLRLGWLPTTWRVRGSTFSSKPAPLQPPADLIPVTFSSDWFESVNGVTQGTNVTAFELLSGGSISTNLTLDDAASTLLLMSSLFTVSLSNMNPALDVNLFDIEQYPDPGYFETTYQGTIFQNGYGYGIDALTVKLSLAILLVFCLIIVTHCVYSISTGISSSAWDSVSEIAVLCLNSRIAPEVNNACAGIQSVHLFQHPVRIAATHGTPKRSRSSSQSSDPMQSRSFNYMDTDHLEMLFPSGVKAALEVVVPNKPYGKFKIG